ncbi:serine hydrolase [Tsukamurella sputi]|uniref:Serine hydrolase n=1 Tax=Tsukamurella sputi TaxID=2591848 RepID=A0A5C5RKI6_9ACTN|nr:serine hydrolase [Tsukamurella sputi]TWS23220.1 serine hydrolase [Tsukamurella sputi]
MRRPVLAALTALLVAAGPVPAAAAAPCPPPPTADTATADGWAGYLAQHRDEVSLVVDDGRGGTLQHRADVAMPTASMVKLVHLAALTAEAAAGRIDMNERIPLSAWQKWYKTSGGTPTDGGMHIEALKYLGIPADDGVPRNMSGTVSLHQLADVMIRLSDSAAPDAILARLGDGPLRAVMDRYGMPGAPPVFASTYDSLLAANASTEQALFDAIRRHTYSAPARSFARLIRDLATGEFGPGAALARPFLEWQSAGPEQLAPVGLQTLGFKGGSFPGVRTLSVEGRRPDGSVATAVFMVERVPMTDLAKDNAAAMPHQAMLIDAMTDADTRGRVACALRS